MAIDPAVIPRIEGDMDALAGHAQALTRVGVDVADTGARVHATWQGLASVYRAPEAGQLLAATLPVSAVSRDMGSDIEQAAAALQTYAATVRPIQQRLEQLRAQAVVFVAEGGAAGRGEFDQDRADEEHRIESAVDHAVADFYAAQRACANTINALYGGAQYRAHDGDGRHEPGEYGYSARQLDRGLGAQPGHPWGTPARVDPGVLAEIRGMVTSMLPTPPAGATPEQNAAWWASLTAGQQHALLVTSTRVVGNMAGLPAHVRSTANTARLYGAKTRLDDQIARLQAALPDGRGPGYETTYHDELRRLEQLQAKRASITAIEATLNKPGERQLLLLDLSGERAEAAVAIGDVDTAEHVAVFTPGFTSTVDGSLAGYDEQMDQLQEQAYRQSLKYGDGGSVATVTWIGYQAPQELGEVVTAGHAEAGADTLAETFRGINASRADDPHLTAIGHSYGSTTTGLAAQQPGTGVDDVVFAGSPGIGTSDVDDLHVPERHAYVVEASWDPVADVGRFGPDPNRMEGVTGLSAREETVGGRRLAETTGHSSGDANGYLAEDTASQYNISTVVAGVPERAVHDRGVGVGDLLW
ncbi:MAG: hypothetical protein GEV09_19095 [Pseudonocardiaceae bacterium]|nr:hypothetical protein [Pseudonocardiaceae bacterium]